MFNQFYRKKYKQKRKISKDEKHNLTKITTFFILCIIVGMAVGLIILFLYLRFAG